MRHSVLAGVLVFLLTFGIVAASYIVWEHTFETEVIPAPITVEITKDLPDQMQIGESAYAEYLITNPLLSLSQKPVTITATWPGTEDSIKCCATIQYYYHGNVGDTITEDDYDGTETFTLAGSLISIHESNTARVQLNILVTQDTQPDSYYFPVAVVVETE